MPHIAKNFMDIVASLSAMKLDKLYENALFCEAILRSLPPLVKKYALQLIYINAPVTAGQLQEWVASDASKHRVAIDTLIELRLFTRIVDRNKETTYLLNPMFQMNLREYINCGVLPREPVAANITVSLEELDIYATQQWECFLLHLINSAEAVVTTKSISPSMMKVFQRGLLRDEEGPRLTESGFQFLLMDTNAQVWYIIRKYLSYSEGYIVVETNFKLYAYSTSKLHCEILSLFARVEYQLPNLIVGSITKDNLYKAFENGITADQIVSYLQQNAHPRVAERVPSVPENVTDLVSLYSNLFERNIRLWELDQNREHR